MWNVVIVDDEIRIAEGLKKIITRMNNSYQVIEVFDDSEAAYQFLKDNKHKVDLLITDICMPGLSGLELLEKVRKFHRSLPCIILTGYGEFEYAQKSIELGVVRYLLKPVDIEELTQTMENLIPHNNEVSSNTTCSNLSKEVLFLKKEIEMDFRDFDMNAKAGILGLSKEYLYRQFRKEMDISVKEYLQNVRLEKAKQYISEVGKYKIYEVCEMVGYEDQVYFSKIFKKKFQVSPKDYQKYYLN